jgi:hypothetical protein
MRWDGLSPPIELLPANEAWGASARDVTADGTLVVGSLYLLPTALEDRSDRAAGLWTEQRGRMVLLQDLLASHYGLAEHLEGYHLTIVRDVTDDGRYMVGNSINPDGVPEAWFLDLGLAGDFDGNDSLDLADLDLLTLAIQSGETDLQFDLDYSNEVNSSDRQYWVQELKNTWFGDANLDGEFNSSDLVAVFEAGQYEDEIAGNSGWGTGDWNGDTDFNTSDLVLAFQDGGYEQGLQTGVKSVPEPSAVWSLILGVILITRQRW